jgi:hypothetical protein
MTLSQGRLALGVSAVFSLLGAYYTLMLAVQLEVKRYQGSGQEDDEKC